MQSSAQALKHPRPPVRRRKDRRGPHNRTAPDRIPCLLQGEGGATAVEYAVMLALLVSIMISGISYFGDEAKALSEVTVNALDNNLTSSE